MKRRSLCPRRLDPRSQSRRIHRIRFEILEDRRLLSLPPVTWVATSSGNWDVGTNWSTGQVPGSTDDVVINPSAALTVTINSSVPPVNSLQSGSNATLSLSGGSLAMAAASEIDGPFALNGGTLDPNAPVTTTANSTWSGGTISGTGTLTNSGVITLTPTASSDAYLQFSGNVTLAGSGQLVMGSEVDGHYVFTYPTSGSTVTNAAGFTIKSVGNGYFGDYQEGTVVNQGTLEADGGGLTVNSASTTNDGTWEAINNGAIEVGPNTGLNNSSGLITADSTSTVYNFGTIQGGSITLSNGGTLSNGESEYPGAITGSTLTLSGGATMVGNGTMSGVTIPTGSDLLIASNSSGTTTQTMAGTITDNGTIELMPTSHGYVLVPFSGNVTLTGTGQMLFDPEVNNYIALAYPTSGSTVTNAAGFTIKSVGNGYFGDYQEGTVVNQGTLEADGGGLTVNSASTTNDGTWEAINNGAIEVGPNTGLNNSSGLITADSTSTVYNFGTIQGGSITLSNGGTLSNGESEYPGAITGSTLTLSGGANHWSATEP